ncbi:PID-CTERM protein-sorting domain-containing protein [Flavivirga eckloniae]|uniref:Signal peptidase n=1 Tax=Flavivirga eckloniae TaxID=1803846 RepID=A0A2K9PR28_9FLAO|nr:hypothetical protein [Flavivirga eckloniae]AUP79530.1 hypothetical protein C1H87_12755 [Flavivirga eckloniae]
MTEQNKRILASTLFMLISFVSMAQTTPPPPPSGPPPGLPIDGGVLLGMVFALFYGIRKLMIKNNH